MDGQLTGWPTSRARYMDDQAWRLAERQLWDAMFWQPRITSDSRRGVRLTAEAKLAGRKPPRLLSGDEVTARSWQAYDRWIGH